MEFQEDVDLAVAAVNACHAVNPENPQAVAEAIPELVKLCRAFCFISDNEYLDPCESNRRTKAIILAEARAALAKAGGKEE